MSRLGALFLLPLAAAACGASPRSSPTPSPTSVAGPRVEMPSGAVYRLEIARTAEEQQQGLMYRESLPDRLGMIFVFSEASVHHFWMKNTMIPLDIIWMAADGKVIFVSANTPPCKSDPCPNYGPEEPAPLVLEIAGGMAAREGIGPGKRLHLRDVR